MMCQESSAVLPTRSTRLRAVLPTLLLAGLLAGMCPARSVQAQARDSTACASCTFEARHRVTLAEITGINALVWGINRFLKNEHWTYISVDSWARNLKHGLHWDHNVMTMNQVMHPYHGNLYFNAARVNGFGYWASAAYTTVGSLMWELFGETHPPSANDLITTTLGGMAMGETFYRLAAHVESAPYTGRTTATGAYLLSPMMGLTRLLGLATNHRTGDGGNAPAFSRRTLQLGVRDFSRSRAFLPGKPHFFGAIDYGYGTPFETATTQPFAAFDLDVAFNLAQGNPVDHFQIRGALLTRSIRRAYGWQLLAGFYQHFDYTHNPTYELGAQSVGASALHSAHFSQRMSLQTVLHLNAVVLGATPSANAALGQRRNAYGPGLGFKVETRLQRDRKRLLTLYGESLWMTSRSFGYERHRMQTWGAQLDVPFFRTLGLGVNYSVYLHNTVRNDRTETYLWSTQLRTFLAWHLPTS